jgi:hypothetical protein
VLHRAFVSKCDNALAAIPIVATGGIFTLGQKPT